MGIERFIEIYIFFCFSFLTVYSAAVSTLVRFQSHFNVTRIYPQSETSFSYFLSLVIKNKSPLFFSRYPGILRSDLIGQSAMAGVFQGGGGGPRRHDAREPVGLLQPSKHNGDLGHSAQP